MRRWNVCLSLVGMADVWLCGEWSDSTSRGHFGLWRWPLKGERGEGVVEGLQILLLCRGCIKYAE